MIDTNHLCPGCMKPWDDTTSPCPRCGFSWDTVKSDSRELPPFTILAGRYLLGRKLGAGGFGITYIAMDLAEETPAAVKEFFPMQLADREGEEVVALPGEDGRYFREALRSFRKEAELLPRFAGVEGVVPCRDFVQENGTAYLVMDYVEGENIKQYMRRTGETFSQERTLELMRPILLAVGALHREHVLHRDISPENLILRPDGTLCLIDFGAAREFHPDEDENLTVILKHGYAPEEQYHSGSRQGPWTDLYACCAVLYQMVSGILPQDAASRGKKDDLLPLDEIGGLEVTDPFARTIEKGMTLRATDRYPSIQELMADLYPKEKPDTPEKGESGEDGGETEAPSPSLPDTDSEPADARPEPEKNTAAKEGADKKADTKAAEKPPAKPRRSSGKYILAILALLIVAAAVYYGVTVPVPNVAGMNTASALSTLNDTSDSPASRVGVEYLAILNSGLDFNVSVEYEYSDDVDADTVISQSASGRVLRNSDVVLQISLGPAVNVPDVYGLTEKEATEILRSSSLTPVTEYESLSPDYGSLNASEAAELFGVVTAQSIESGTTTTEGTKVEIRVTIPDETSLQDYLATLSGDAAETYLTGLGFSVETELEYTDSVEKGQVISASVSAHSGSASLSVSNGPEYVTVPDVRGMTYEEAVEMLENIGLDLSVELRTFYSEYGEGLVGYQITEAGTTIKAGSSVYVFLSCGKVSSSKGSIKSNKTSVTMGTEDSVKITLTASSGHHVAAYWSFLTPLNTGDFGTWYTGKSFSYTLKSGTVTGNGMLQIVLYDNDSDMNPLDYVNIYYTIE